MPNYHTKNFQDWIREAVGEYYEAFDSTDFKATFVAEVLKDTDVLYDYVNDDMMPLVFPEWNSEDFLPRAIMNTVDWDELLTDLKSDFNEEDSESIV